MLFHTLHHVDYYQCGCLYSTFLASYVVGGISYLGAETRRSRSKSPIVTPDTVPYRSLSIR